MPVITWGHGEKRCPKYTIAPRRHIYKYISLWWLPPNSLQLYNMMLLIPMWLSRKLSTRKKSDNFSAHSFQNPSQTFFFRFIAFYTSEWYKNLGVIFTLNMQQMVKYSKCLLSWKTNKTEMQISSSRKRKTINRIIFAFLSIIIILLMNKEVQEVI